MLLSQCLTVYANIKFTVCLTCRFVVSLQKTAYMIASGVICLIYILSAVVLFFGVREQKGKSTSIVGLKK